jgi:hypothetical protein
MFLTDSLKVGSDAEISTLQYEESVCYHPHFRTRFGIPHWAPFRPQMVHTIDNPVITRDSDLWLLFGLLTKGVKVTMASVFYQESRLPATTARVRSVRSVEESRLMSQSANPFSPIPITAARDVDANEENSLRLIELRFSSAAEAKTRCALLMIGSFEYVSKTCAVMMSAEEVADK